jgi:hypothetical protein
MSKLNQSAGQSAMASSTASLHALPASQASSLDDAAAHSLSHVAELASLARSLLSSVLRECTTDEGHLLPQLTAARSTIEQLGWIADAGTIALGREPHLGDAGEWFTAAPLDARMGARHE